MKSRFLLVSSIALLAGYNYSKDITFTNETNRPIVLRIVPGRSSKLARGTGAFDSMIAPLQNKTLTVYSEQFGGQGNYVNNLQIAWGDKDVNFFFDPEVDLQTLNAFIHSKSSKQPITIKWVPQFDRKTFKEIGGSFKVVLPEVSEVTQKRRKDIIETHRQARQAKKGLKRAWELFTGKKN